MSDQIPIIGGEKPDPAGPISSSRQLAWVLSEMCDDSSPVKIARWHRVAKSICSRMAISARIQPSREEIIAAIRRCNYPDGPIINSISERVAEVSADAVLALLPGRTEAEVREQVAQELLSDASGRPFPHAYVRLMNPLKGEHPVRTFRAAVEILARGIARGGERS